MKRQIITLGIANIAEFAIQVFIPIVLVRVLDEISFGEYRLLWLAAGTLLAIVPFGIPASLPYFLPRHDLHGQAVFVRQALFYMATAGILAWLVLGPWNSLLPHSVRTMAGADFAAPLFCALWVFGSTLDILPNAERRIELQAGLIFGLALLRVGAVLTAAVLGGIHAVIGVLAFVAATKALLLLAISTARYGWRLWFGRMTRWLEQARYAIPVGADNAVYLLRMQADQWLVVVLFGSAQYGVYSIGAAALALAGLIRITVTRVIFPEMSKAQAEGDLAKVLSLNSRSNVAVALFILPVIAFIFAAASPLIRLIYTEAYADAIPVLRLNAIASLITVVEMSTVMLVLRQGPFLLRVNIILLLVGLLASYAGSQVWGVPGAVAGVIVGSVLAISLVYARASRLVDLPVSALQDWRTIACIGGAAFIAGLAAYLTLFLIPPTLGHVLAILVSGVVFCCAYLPSLVGLGQWGLVADVLGLAPDSLRHLRKRSGRIIT
ncbi:MAG TPA: oligosaccharide flippase family protein [Acidobacteriota bacterium]|jgi:O-antigen/teichoic acid export membrane protein